MSDLNVCATFRYALAYPAEQHLEFLRRVSTDVPETLGELRVLYISLFEAGFPRPHCPLLESHYTPNRPATEVVLENKLFYKHFGLTVESKAAPDHLLTQLEFLSWLDYCLAAGNPDCESLEIARREFLARHVSHWLPLAAAAAQKAEGRCYTGIVSALAEELTASNENSALMTRSSKSC